jgi:agmatine deiminase
MDRSRAIGSSSPGRFLMPAEWEPHEATWIAWPHRLSDWPSKFAAIPWVYGEIVRHLVRSETVRIIVPSRDHEARARRVLGRVGVDSGRIEFFRFPLDRGWTRDFGPIFVRQRRTSSPVIARFRFNAWAKYPDWSRDDAVPARAAKALGLPLAHCLWNGRPVVMEGGAIDVNGRGALLATEECLLDETVQTRNPGLGRRDLESVLHEWLGAREVIWLGRGIAGDDTHGHVDDLCRFVGPTTVVLCEERNPGDANYWALQENKDRLRSARLRDSKLEVVSLPMPAPVVFRGQRLPASYANFYIANSAVLVPTFNDPADRQALGLLAELFRDRQVVGIHAVDLVWGLGTLHCLSQQQPAR